MRSAVQNVGYYCTVVEFTAVNWWYTWPKYHYRITLYWTYMIMACRHNNLVAHSQALIWIALSPKPYICVPSASQAWQAAWPNIESALTHICTVQKWACVKAAWIQLPVSNRSQSFDRACPITFKPMSAKSWLKVLFEDICWFVWIADAKSPAVISGMTTTARKCRLRWGWSCCTGINFKL